MKKIIDAFNCHIYNRKRCFKCKKASDMKFDVLRDRVKYFKEEGGRDSMCKLVEKYGNERAKEEKTNNIIALLKQGVPSQTIHEALKVPLRVVQELENSLKIGK